ncbi:MAG: hypothetical protein ACE5H8_07190, partial [Alphaproteobacteria bacterium]
ADDAGETVEVVFDEPDAPAITVLAPESPATASRSVALADSATVRDAGESVAVTVDVPPAPPVVAMTAPVSDETAPSAPAPAFDEMVATLAETATATAEHHPSLAEVMVVPAEAVSDEDDAPGPEASNPAVVAALDTAGASPASAGEGEGNARSGRPAHGAFKIRLGLFPDQLSAAKILIELRDSHVDLLSGLRFEIAKTNPDGPVLAYQLLAGPLASEAVAADLCTRLHSRKEGCTLVAE